MKAYEKQTEAIRACGKELLEAGKVDVVLGYRLGSLDDALIPYFARSGEETEALEWGDRAFQNLAPYLHGRKDRVAIVAKPCDVRAVVQYIVEKQLERERVYIIGVDCCGMVDAEGAARPGCDECRVRIPPICDTHITDERAPRDVKIEYGEDNSPERFQREIDKCILCYSCRQACYGCYCKTCFVERGMTNWLPPEVDSGTKKTFHMGRAMHLAGRCVECGACEAACASGVNLRYIIKELTGFVEDAYGYQAGMSLEEKPPLVDYADDDREIGFLGDDKA